MISFYFALGQIVFFLQHALFFALFFVEKTDSKEIV